MSTKSGHPVARREVGVDVFVDPSQPGGGNPLAVVIDGDGLDHPAMLRFAQRKNLSEVTFVKQSLDPNAHYLNEIYMTTGPIPMAGHPSLGTAAAVAHARGVTSATYIQQTRAGLQPVTVTFEGGRAYASMLQEPGAFGEPLVDRGPVLRALGLGAGDGHPTLPVQSVSTGIRHLMVPVSDLDALRRAQPTFAEVKAITEATGTVVLYLFALDASAEEVVARGFFATDSELVEDPATGSAAGTLGVYHARHTRTTRLRIRQGEQVGRPSRIDTELDGTRVRVGGYCVISSDEQSTL